MKTWTEEELKEIYVSDDFNSIYQEYCSDNKEQRDLLKFLDISLIQSIVKPNEVSFSSIARFKYKRLFFI